MPALTLAEQTRLAVLATDRARRSALARVLGSRLLRWRYGAPIADELLIVPQDLRTADPSFASEIAQGHFGFGGATAHLGEGSPFDLPPPSPEWQRELHGFGWLRHLRAADTQDARDLGAGLVQDWIHRQTTRSGIAWEAPVIGRRIMSWVASAPMLLDDIDQATYDRTADSLGAQLIHLSATWCDAADGYPRLLALTGLLFGDLCIAGHDRHLGDVEHAFGEEVERQILPDGGHISRNPGVLVELLLDFLPLRQCFATRGRQPPEVLDGAIRRIMPMLRLMRLGDGTLARFNGMGAPSPEALATVLAYGDAADATAGAARASGYVRLQRGDTIVIADTGSPPPLHLAGQAHAGCLAFEMSAGKHAILVNGGVPGPADQEWRAAARATASHNTLCAAGKSSSKLVRNDLLESLVGAPPIRFPDHVRSHFAERDGAIEVQASHDGYMRSLHLMHFRRLMLDVTGCALIGHDRLGPTRGSLRLARDVPFAVHFHLHPDVTCTPDGQGAGAELILRDGQRWRFTAQGAALSVEESAHYADPSGPRRTLQLVLRGASFGETDVHWTLARTNPTPPDPTKPPPLPAGRP
jgi:uncharacterized heparinase superfamily protein